ncbi:hypothetical protein [Streptomyces huiliensis]|uniref:hypothetical protein n=1 Tax=Streptomyces huiliensis TaxID=2876027 RepID=UPI001CBE35B3|nr:hypothetical protein [Streptomyces huiliensis]MBZ4319459.1 hypothetical protein [Streptomyces huiliensis]
MDLSSQTFTITGLHADPPGTAAGKGTKLKWKISDGKPVVYTMRYAGPTTPYTSIDQDTFGRQVKVENGWSTWQTPALNDWTVLFLLSAQRAQAGQDHACVPVPVAGAAVKFGDLDAKGAVSITDAGTTQYLFDDTKLFVSQGEKWAEGVIDDVSTDKKKLGYIFPRAKKAGTDGLLTIQCTGTPATDDHMIVKTTPPPPVQGDRVSAHTAAPPPAGKAKDWRITPGTTLTLPLAAGTRLDMTEPVYSSGTRSLTMHWTAFGGRIPLTAVQP